MTAHPTDDPVCLQPRPGPRSPDAGGWVPLDRYAARFWLPVLGPVPWALWCALVVYTDESERPVWRGLRALARSLGCDWRTLVGRDRDGRHHPGAVDVLERWGLLRVAVQPDGSRLWWVTRRPPLLPAAAVAALPDALQAEHARWVQQHPDCAPGGRGERRKPRRPPAPGQVGVGTALHPVGQAPRPVGTSPPKENPTRAHKTEVPAPVDARLLQRWHLVTEAAQLPPELVRRAREQLQPVAVELDAGGVRLTVRAWSTAEASRWSRYVPRLSAALAGLVSEPGAAVTIVGPGELVTHAHAEHAEGENR